MKSINDAVDLLNEAYSIDPNAISDITKTRVICNDKLKDHPSIQVSVRENYMVGLLGLLNGIFSNENDGYICAIYDNDNNLLGFDIKKF
jgi:hypothetical protein